MYVHVYQRTPGGTLDRTSLDLRAMLDYRPVNEIEPLMGWPTPAMRRVRDPQGFISSLYIGCDESGVIIIEALEECYAAVDNDGGPIWGVGTSPDEAIGNAREELRMGRVSADELDAMVESLRIVPITGPLYSHVVFCGTPDRYEERDGVLDLPTEVVNDDDR